MTGARGVVYTAIFGGYDTLKQPVAQDQPCEFVCFTDEKGPASVGAWRMVRLESDAKVHPRMQAKWFKLQCHKVFPDGRLASRYAPFSIRFKNDLSIWIDGSIRIKSPSFVRDMRARLGAQDWAMFVHPDRDCIYDEASISAGLSKYDGLPIFAQVEAYKRMVAPHGGLFACGVIVRREPESKLVTRANEMWWNENVKWTYQDQVSLPFVLRTLSDCDPVAIPEPLRSNEWFDIVRHNRNT
jgi:hypothetical protein